MKHPCVILLILLAILATSCVTVQPWQRGILSEPAMELKPRIGGDFHNHVRQVREAAIGGEGGAGGGCGCN
ncbi:MAG: DUF4266 domain-containing protein [Deltaproteobacteria bacterium]|nr:DUF4266 domain-containing protein [Deltaproteobacteria bacterium]